MISAEVWIAGWQKKMDDLGYEGFIEPEFVKEIQADALKEAIRLVTIRDQQSVECDCACAADDIFQVVEALQK